MEKEQEEFNKVNKKDRYYLNFAGLKEYQTFVGKPLEKLYKSIMKDIIDLLSRENPEGDPYEESRKLFPGVKQTFPNFMPMLSQEEVNNLSNKEIDEILARLQKYHF